jgi:hypothetical protein
MTVLLNVKKVGGVKSKLPFWNFIDAMEFGAKNFSAPVQNQDEIGKNVPS